MILPFSTSRSSTSLISNCLYCASFTPRTMFSKSMNIASFLSSLIQCLSCSCVAHRRRCFRKGPCPSARRPHYRGSPRANQPLSRHGPGRSEEHPSELQSRGHLVCRLLLEKN